MKAVYVTARVNGSVELAEVLEALDKWGVTYEVSTLAPGEKKAPRAAASHRKRRVLLSREQAADMRKRWKAGEWASFREAAVPYGVSPSVARRVIQKLENWA